jgi:DNA-binding transcriptional MerR regulator
LDKAPDAFRTISEVADDLDIPQHVLRFWETRFAQIKPMKRSGGRRYYRPDDVDLLKGIRRLLYGEGYTIRGVQRILKEHGIKSVQGLADSSAAVTFGAIEEAIGQSLAEGNGEDFGVDLDAEDEGKAAPSAASEEEDGIDFRFVDAEDDFLEAFRGGKGRKPAAEHNALDREKLEGVLRDLIACRHMLDRVMKDG